MPQEPKFSVGQTVFVYDNDRDCVARCRIIEISQSCKLDDDGLAPGPWITTYVVQNANDQMWRFQEHGIHASPNDAWPEADRPKNPFEGWSFKRLEATGTGPFISIQAPLTSGPRTGHAAYKSQDRDLYDILGQLADVMERP